MSGPGEFFYDEGKKQELKPLQELTGTGCEAPAWYTNRDIDQLIEKISQLEAKIETLEDIIVDFIVN